MTLPVVADTNVETFRAQAAALVEAVESCDDPSVLAEWREMALAWEEFIDRKAEDRGPAQVAARMCEARIGELLGPRYERSDAPDLWPDKRSAAEFRLLAEHRDAWEPHLPCSFREAVKRARAARRAAALPTDEPPPLDDTPDVFTTIVADPPWRYDNVATRGAAEDHYPTMTIEELCALEVPAADNAHLYLWTTNGFLREAFDVMDAWGFTYKTTLTWCKPQIGMGNWFRNTTEHVLFGVRGKLPTNVNNKPTHFVADRTRHSQKPDSFYDLVQLASPGPYFEMFARRRRFGWHVWGNEA